MTDPTYRFLLREELEPGIVRLTLNDPERLNAAGPGMHHELSRIWAELAAADGIRVILLTGAGRAFSAGGDVRAMRDMWRTRDVPGLMREARDIFFGMLELPQPIIALVNGPAVGLGATLALSCDIVLAAEGAKIGDTHVNVGLVAGDGGAVLWPMLVGVHRAKHHLLTAELLDADRAAEIGLINEAVPSERLHARGLEIARRLAALPPLALRWTKLSINRTVRLMAASAFESSIALEATSMLSEDHLEAATAFLDKRTPNYKGR